MCWVHFANWNTLCCINIHSTVQYCIHLVRFSSTIQSSLWTKQLCHCSVSLCVDISCKYTVIIVACSEDITNLCRILGRFSIFLRFVRTYACEQQFHWKTLSSIFFLPICVSYLINNVCKTAVFPKLELRRRNVICKPLSQNESLAPREKALSISLCTQWKTQLFAYVISRIRNANRQKKNTG